MKDDRTLHRDRSKPSECSNPSTPSSQFQREENSSSHPLPHSRLQDKVVEKDVELQIITTELNWYAELPLTSPSTLLVFVNKPRGNYHWPSIPVDAMQYNSGFYALVESHRANSVFLTTESRLCEIHANLVNKLERGGMHTRDLSEQASDVFDLLQEQLSRMCKEKEYHWDLQRSRDEIRANNPTDAILCSNGERSPQILIPLS